MNQRYPKFGLRLFIKLEISLQINDLITSNCEYLYSADVYRKLDLKIS